MRIGRADQGLGLGLGLGFFPGGAPAIFFYLFLYLFPVVVVLVIRRRWRISAERAEEVRRLARMAAAEAAMADIEAAALAYAPTPPLPPPLVATTEEIGLSEDGIRIERSFPPLPAAPQQCAVCYRSTTRRCARCKAVRYCGGKCQINHWRQGHKDECHPPRFDDHSSGQESASSLKGLQSDQFNSGGNSSELDVKFQTESDQSNSREKSSELDRKFQTKPVEPLSKRPSESKCSDVLSERDINGTKLFVHTYGTESSSDSFIDASSLSSSLSSSWSSSSSLAAQPQPSSSNCSTSSLPETYHDASAREDSRMLHHDKVGIGSCINSFLDNSRGRASGSESKLTRGLSANLSINNSCTSKLEPMVSSCKEKDVECRLSGPTDTSFVSSDNGSNSGPSKNAFGCEDDHIHLNADSSQRSTKLMPVQASSSAETFSHQNTLPGVASPPNLRDFKAVDVDKSTSVLSGRSNDECFEKLKPRQCLQSLHHGSSSVGRHSLRHDAFSKINITPLFPSKSSEHTGFVPNGVSDLKSSARRVVQQLKSAQHSRSHLSASKNDVSQKYKMLFPYDIFVKLYNCDKVELHPCGLTNCGNSCYANAVLQCLAFTRPLTSYLVQGVHTKTCTSREWCFTCEFGSIIAKLKQGQSPVSPIGILSHIQNIGSNLGQGREEDAHEFLRYAIDTMQTVCLKEAGVSTADRLAVETTLIQLIFGGYIRSKIKCSRCRGKSERRERMMDLTVEIHGDIGTLEDALARFTATEILDGDNKYQCNRCNSYERAKKKLSVLEAPNILTIVLKRFQSGKFGKLNKAVRFPELLNLAPYMSGTEDRSPIYSLYAVVVHQDVMNAAFSGHYVCYIKSTQGKWYKTDDSKVKPVEIERVLTKNAYMLLYARCLPRAPSLIRDVMSYDHLKTKKSRHRESFLSGPGTQVKRHHPHLSRQGQSILRSSDRLPFPRTDSSSDSCSLFSCSDEGSCSTESTRDSTSTDPECVYGDSGRFSWSSAFSEDYSDSLGHSPLIQGQSFAGLSYGERLGWEGEDAGLEGKGSPLFLYSDTTDQCRKLTEECSRGRENDRGGVGLNEMQPSVLMKRSSTSRDRRDQTFY